MDRLQTANPRARACARCVRAEKNPEPDWLEPERLLSAHIKTVYRCDVKDKEANEGEDDPGPEGQDRDVVFSLIYIRLPSTALVLTPQQPSHFLFYRKCLAHPKVFHL